jgi:hypothetical protein
MQLIMNIVEWVLIWFVASVFIVPAFIHMCKPSAVGDHGTGLGAVYHDIWFSAMYHYPTESASAMAIAFFVSAAFPNLAAILAVWAFQITFLIHRSIKRGYDPLIGMT